MADSKVLSIRISADLLAQIDQIAQGRKWWKRNAIINQFLKVMVNGTDWATQQQALQFWPEGGEKVTVTLDFTK